MTFDLNKYRDDKGILLNVRRRYLFGMITLPEAEQEMDRVLAEREVTK